MNKKKKALIAVCLLAITAVVTAVAVNRRASKSKPTPAQMAELSQGDALFDIKTSEGTIRVRLYGDTPAHRDNFAKLAREGYYDGVLFHRVISDFMIQTGDPDSKDAPKGKMLGSGGPDYQIDAEIVYPAHFHKRGALAAARQADQLNPERRSSGSQFYIVTGKVYNDSTLAQFEHQMQMAATKTIFDKLARDNRDKIMELRRNRDQAGLQALQNQLVEEATAQAAANPVKFTDAQKAAYTTVGGTPHLDGQYTVFGEVVDGMNVVDKIEKVETDRADRPLEDVKVISVTEVK